MTTLVTQTNPPLPPPPELRRPSAPCYCFDLCNITTARAFIGRVERSTVTSEMVAWRSYLDTVYGVGRAPMPFDLGRLNFFYTNTRRWRLLRSGVSPFAPCGSEHLAECSKSDCAEWQQPMALEGHLPPASTHTQQLRVIGTDSEQGIQGVLLHIPTRRFPDGAFHFHESYEWLEIIREGTHGRKANGWIFQEGAGTQTLDRNDHVYHIPGCWMRPAAGSGIWISLGRTDTFHSMYGVTNRTHRASGALPGAHYGIMAESRTGFNTIQVRHEHMSESWGVPPIVVLTTSVCVHGKGTFRTCLPVEIRTGWHNERCLCNDSWTVLNCGTHLLPATTPVPPVPVPVPAPVLPWLQQPDVCRASARAFSFTNDTGYPRETINNNYGALFQREDTCNASNGIVETIWRRMAAACLRPDWIAAQLMQRGHGQQTQLVLAGDSTTEQQYRALRCILEASANSTSKPSEPSAITSDGCETWVLGSSEQLLHLCYVWATRYGDLRASKRFHNAISSLVATTVVVGVGAWYHTINSGFAADFASFVRWWSSRIAAWPTDGPRPDLVLREPLPQHFPDNTAGVYLENRPHTRCVVPHKPADFRLTGFNEKRPRGMTVLRLHSLLHPLAEAHNGGDCTHYCIAAMYAVNCELAQLVASASGHGNASEAIG